MVSIGMCFWSSKAITIGQAQFDVLTGAGVFQCSEDFIQKLATWLEAGGISFQHWGKKKEKERKTSWMMWDKQLASQNAFFM